MLSNTKEIDVKKENIVYTILKIIGWILILGMPTIYILTGINNRFGAWVSKGIIEEDSFIVYKQSIFMIFGICAILAIIWWIVATANLKIKEHFENNTYIWTIGVEMLCIVAAVLLQFKFPGIYRINANNTLEYLWYVCGYPLLFFSGILLCSPNNVCEVVIWSKQSTRRIFGIICIIISIVIFALGGK